MADLINSEIAGGTASWTETPKTPDDLAAWVKSREAAGCPALVAETGGTFAGYAGYAPFRPGEAYRPTVEHSVYVDPRFRRRGIARALLERLIDHARSAGRRRMAGWVSADQAASLALHRSLGFEQMAVLDGLGEKRGQRLDGCLVMLRLD